MVCSTLAVTVALLAQKCAVKLKVLAKPAQAEETTVPSKGM